MSISVSYKGLRKVIKVSPTTLMQQVLEESASKFSLDYINCSLLHKNVPVDCSQPFRFSGLSNNAQLELSLITAQNKLLTAQARIALSVEGSGTSSHTFIPSTTLTDVIEHFISIGFISRDIYDRKLELIYLRQKFSVNSFSSTTLSSLGLSGYISRYRSLY